MTKTIKYVGPDVHGVTLGPLAGAISFPQGEPVEVDDELAKSLLQQDIFKEVKAPRAPDVPKTKRGLKNG
jgi:hypothetical protein